MIDKELISAYCLEISDRHKIILNLIPKENESLLKHLAAGCIHLALFAQELAIDESPLNEDYVKEFLKQCGCNIYDEKK